MTVDDSKTSKIVDETKRAQPQPSISSKATKAVQAIAFIILVPFCISIVYQDVQKLLLTRVPHQPVLGKTLLVQDALGAQTWGHFLFHSSHWWGCQNDGHLWLPILERTPHGDY